MLMLRDIDTLQSARGIGEWGWLSRPCCWNKHFYSRTDSRNLTTIPYTMAIVGCESVREEQANGLICCVNKRMSVKALQWHVSVALGMEKGLESSMWSCLVWLWSPFEKTLHGWQKNVCRKQNNGSRNRSLPHPHLFLTHPEEMSLTKGSHCSSHLCEFSRISTEGFVEDILLDSLLQHH